MAFDSADPRAALAPAAAARSEGGVAEPGFHSFTGSTVTRQSAAGSPSWLVRAQNAVLEYTVLAAGDHLLAAAEPDECVIFLPLDGAEIEVRQNGRTVLLAGRGLVSVPPGHHEVTARKTGPVARLFTTANGERASQAVNAGDYARPHPRVAPLEPWPAPVGQSTLRRYSVADAKPDPNRFGNIYRTRTFMVNWLPAETGPRNPEKLSPHFHDDFEQISLAVEGEYIHHIRTPWTPRQSEWRPDLHQQIGSPSVAIIPPPTIHTSQSMGRKRNVLIDIFAGPRADFSAKPGWVLNAADYPLPES